MPLSEDTQYEVNEAFKCTTRFLDGLLNIDNNFFNGMVSQIYLSECQLNKASVSDTEASFLDLQYLYGMFLLLLKYTINEMILILILQMPIFKR